MADYVAKLAELNSASGITADVRDGKKLYAKYAPWLDRYHGGLPAGVLASIMRTESGGKMSAPGDVSLGEVGFYQITANFPTTVGLPAASRYDAETNVFLGALEYQIHAAEMAARYPQVVVLGSADNWKLARLAFAVGNAGARRLIDAAIAKGLVQRGKVLDGIRAMVDSGGAFALSSGQPADKVRYRVHVVDNNFAVGQKISGGLYGSPKTIPAPAGVTYRYPPALLPFTNKVITQGNMTLLGMAALALVGFHYAR